MDGVVTLKEDSASTVGSHARSYLLLRIAFNSFVSLPCMLVLCSCVFASSFGDGSCSFASLETNCRPDSWVR